MGIRSQGYLTASQSLDRGAGVGGGWCAGADFAGCESKQSSWHVGCERAAPVRNLVTVTQAGSGRRELPPGKAALHPEGAQAVQIFDQTRR